jgi:hypothetical protein
MDDKIILICATGRSGSTTLQRIINTIPNSNICGENYAAINSLLEFYKRIKQTSIEQVPGHFTPASYESILDNNIKPCWYNSYNFEQIKQLTKLTIINMFKNRSQTNIWGFKEIRYEYGAINYIKEFKELFPQTKVIIHIRENILKQSQSGWHKHNRIALNYLNNTNNELYQFYNENKEMCYFSTFEKMFDLANIQKIFKFIDCEEYFDKKKIQDVLNNNIKGKE